MRKKPVDLGTVRAARASLEKLAEDFPELRAPSSVGNRAKWEEALDMAAKKKTNREQDEQIVVRVSSALVERIDAYAERLRVEQPGPAWKRSDVVRLLITRALDDTEPRKTKK